MYQNWPSELHQLLFDQGVQIVIPPRSPASVPEPIGTPSHIILHLSDCCLLRQFFLRHTTLFKCLVALEERYR